VSQTLGDFNTFLKNNKLFVPYGQCTDVRLGGHGQTGGYSQLGQSFGLLGDALRDLRYHEKDRVLWIDALCIDQNNNEERGEQVQQMGSIYSKAERVIIWLDYVMYHIKQLEKEYTKHASNSQDIADKQ
jgi:FAD/FMN-containing dehydrogenase